MRRLRWLLLLSGLIGIGIIITSPAVMQCSIRTDWPSYTVVRGDTLYSIAQRYNTNTATLLQANCLSSTRILRGQQIRVPPNGVIETPTPVLPNIPEAPGGTFMVGATYQEFEHGFMTWRSDSGAIWVFYGNGHAVSYPLHKYGGLAISRRLMFLAIPPGRRLPTNGFMRVYDNFPEVRENLGWAIGDEEGYDMLLTVPTFGSGFFTMSVPDGQQWSITNEGIWGHVTGVAVPPATPTPSLSQDTTGATFQAFEHGFMVWREDNGNISVYVGQENGELTTYRVDQYGGLSTRRYTPPTGRWYPQFGFGKVWSNIPGIREQLGWALGSERGYEMILVASDLRNNLTSFSLPDGRFVTQSSGTSWIITPNGILVNP